MMGRITKRSVDQLKPGQFLSDSEIAGFIARRLPSGLITYGYQYRAGAGKRKWMSLGKHGVITPDQACGLAEKYADLRERNKDPAAARDKETATTVNALLDSFVENYLTGRRSEKEITRAIDRLVRPKIGKRSIYDLRRSDMSELFDGIASNSGPVMADRTLAYVRKAFNWWHETRDEDFHSPISKGMTRLKPSEIRRDRVLDDQEVRDLWRALDDVDLEAPACFPAFVRTLLLTGQRLRNVSKMSADEIEGDRWLIPGVRMKGGKPHLVPITPAIKEQISRGGEGFVFTSDGGKTPFSGFSKAKVALDRKIAETRKRHKRKPMQHWRFHDLRRTARTIMSRYTTPDIAERVLGHVIPGVRGVYDLYEYEAEKRAALEKLGAHVLDLVACGQS
jgi:integrase